MNILMVRTTLWYTVVPAPCSQSPALALVHSGWGEGRQDPGFTSGDLSLRPGSDTAAGQPGVSSISLRSTLPPPSLGIHTGAKRAARLQTPGNAQGQPPRDLRPQEGRASPHLAPTHPSSSHKVATQQGPYRALGAAVASMGSPKPSSPQASLK